MIRFFDVGWVLLHVMPSTVSHSQCSVLCSHFVVRVHHLRSKSKTRKRTPFDALTQHQKTSNVWQARDGKTICCRFYLGKKYFLAFKFVAMSLARGKLLLFQHFGDADIGCARPELSLFVFFVASLMLHQFEMQTVLNMAKPSHATWNIWTDEIECQYIDCIYQHSRAYGYMRMTNATTKRYLSTLCIFFVAVACLNSIVYLLFARVFHIHCPSLPHQIFAMHLPRIQCVHEVNHLLYCASPIPRAFFVCAQWNT